MKIDLVVNGQSCSAQVEENTLLADFLREQLGLTGVHLGCDTSQCGCCTVHLDGRAVKSCTLLAVQAQGCEVLTVEGLAAPDAQPHELHPVQQAFSACHGLQCGYCTPGMIMATVDLLKRCPNPSQADMVEGLAGNLCRCTGYLNIMDAVQLAAKTMQGQS
jgi:carbon-monoxide dehydrogenase small subunit